MGPIDGGCMHTFPNRNRVFSLSQNSAWEHGSFIYTYIYTQNFLGVSSDQLLTRITKFIMNCNNGDDFIYIYIYMYHIGHKKFNQTKGEEYKESNIRIRTNRIGVSLIIISSAVGKLKAKNIINLQGKLLQIQFLIKV